MISYGLFSAVLDLIGLASTVTVIALLISGLQPLFERVRDSCRACKPPEGRALLLWYALLIYIAWMAAAALYFRNLFALWDFMGTWLDREPINRPVYALLHFYLFFLLVSGIYACAITLFEMSQNPQVFNDLFMIARFKTRSYQAIEDLEAQHDGSSSTGPVDAEAETPATVGNVRDRSPLQQDERSRGNAQERNEDVAPAEARISEPEHLTQEAARPRYGRPVGEISTPAICSPIRSVTFLSWPTSASRNNSETAGSLGQHHATIDSDSDTVISTPSSSSSNAPPGIDEPEYVEDDRYSCHGVKLPEPLEDRERRNSNASDTIDQCGYVEDDDDDDDSHGLYNATPRLSPQDRNAGRHVERIDIGPPPSPCDSCTSAHAGSIPTVKRCPVRVPITPTSPTADGDDADTEKTDVERKQRERKKRNPETSARPNPHANTSTTLPRLEPEFRDDSENMRTIQQNLRTHGLGRRERTAASIYMSSKQKPTPSPITLPVLSTSPVTPPLCERDREAGLYWRSSQAKDKGNAALGDTEYGILPSPTRSPQPRRPRSPYPFAAGRLAAGAEGGRGLSDLSLQIPEAELDTHGREGASVQGGNSSRLGGNLC